MNAWVLLCAFSNKETGWVVGSEGYPSRHGIMQTVMLRTFIIKCKDKKLTGAAHKLSVMQGMWCFPACSIV